MGVFDMFKKKGEPAAGPAKPVPAAASQPEVAAAPPAGFFGSLRQALRKTSDFLNTDIRDLFKREGRLVDEAFLEELFAILVKTDMGIGPAGRIRDRIATDFRARVVHMSDVLASVKDEVRQILRQPEQPIAMAASGPTVVLVVGVNGSGKTTSIAKLTNRFRSEGKKVVLGAGDTFRAAAVEQLTIWAERFTASSLAAWTTRSVERSSTTESTIMRSLRRSADLFVTLNSKRVMLYWDEASRVHTSPSRFSS